MIELYDHNKEAYEKTIDMLDKEKKCCIIHPTGTGKSYIALKWLYENKDKKGLFVTSSLSIIDNIKRTIRENNMSLEEDFPNLKIITYTKLMKDPYINADNIVLDEFHRTGAEKWGEGVSELLAFNKNANVLGLSATPVRYLDGKRDMSEEIFNGNVSSHITLPYAIANGILPVPTYINAIYSFKEEIDRIEDKINKLKDENDKKDLLKELERARRLIEQADNLEEVFSKYMDKKDGKYLVFCRDIKHLEEMKEEVPKLLRGVNKDIDVSYIHSGMDQELNKYTVNKFHYAKGKDLKLLFSVGMLNEGVHTKDVDGSIMLRPTSSPILYFQQLGRALTTGNKKNPLVFDIVNNIKCLRDIENLRDSIVRIMTKSSKTKEEIELVVKNFRIIDDYKEVSQLLEELDINSTYGWDENYEKLKEFVDKNGRFPTQNEPCGSWLSTQRISYRKGKLSKERKEKLDKLGDGDWLNPKETTYDRLWNKKYEELEESVNENHRFPTQNEPCGKWLNEQRVVYRKGKLSKEREAKLNLLGNWLNPQKEIEEQRWNENYEKLKEFVEAHKGRFPTQNEPCGSWLNNQRVSYRKGKLSKEREAKLKLLGDWCPLKKEIEEQRWNENYEKLKEFVEAHKGRFPTKNEPCGSWLNNQRVSYRKGELSKEREAKLNLLGDWLNSQKEIEEQRWNENYEKLKEFVEAHKGRFPTKDEICGVWLNNQRASYRKGELSKEREVKLNLLGDWHLSKKEIDEQRWNENYEKLKEFVNENHRFPIYNELCGEWLSRQRKSYRKGELSKEREAKLNLLGDWVTSTRRRKVKSIERKEEEIKDRKPRT